MVALASGFARSPRSLAGVRIRDRRLRPAARSRLRSIVLRRVCARTPKTRLPGVAPRLRRRATRRLRRLSLPSSPPAVCSPADSASASASPVAAADAVGFAFASPVAAAVAFAPASSEEVSGRVASRPGYPAEPAARSRPFGRVSLAPPPASRAARSACPGGSLRSPPPAFPPPPWVAPALRPVRRCRLSAWALCARRASAPRPDRSPAAAAHLRFRSRNRSPHRRSRRLGSVPRPEAGYALTPHAAGCPERRDLPPTTPDMPSTYIRVRPSTTESCSRRAGKSSVNLTAPFSQIACTAKTLIQRPKSRSCCAPFAIAVTQTYRIPVLTDLQGRSIGLLNYRLDPVAFAHHEQPFRFRTSNLSVHVPAQWTESSFRKNGNPHGQDNVKDRSRDR